MVEELIMGITSWLSSFPIEDGIDPHQSLNSIVLGSSRGANNCIQIGVGSYTQIYDTTTNTMKGRTISGIVLHPFTNTADNISCHYNLKEK